MTDATQDSQDSKSIQLGRIFFDVTDLSENDDFDERIWTAKMLGRGMTWSQLLEHPCIVVLGEAGTGKTTEFRLQAASQSQAGDHAFFVEINGLARDGLGARLDLPTESRLDSWLNSQEHANFFLDSLDEAKLQKRTLRDALLKLQKELRDSWERVRLVISCRASDWQEYADRANLMSFTRQSPEETGTEVRIVQLAPLDHYQVEKLAQHLGITSVSDFMRAIDDSFAHNFIERPLDVEWIGAYWKRHGHLGTYRDLISENIEQKLAERPDRSPDLPMREVKKGAQALAGIATLTRRLSIMIPGEPLEPSRDQSALNTNDVLTDWSAHQIKDLLSRGIFDEATFGRVRFHHRSIQEYLAACWLRDLSTNGLPHEKLRQILLREEADTTVVSVHLQPVLAWLCLWDSPLRAEIVQKCPALLISHGDPDGLTESEREEILISYAKTYRSRSRLFDNFEIPSLTRFSAPALATVLAKMLDDASRPDELRAMLFELVELGKVEACASHALSAALDENQSMRVRSTAIRTVAAVGDAREKTELVSLLNSTTIWSQDLAHAFIKATYPDRLPPHALVQILAKMDPTPRHHMTSLQMMLEHDVPQRSDARSRLELLEHLMDLIHKDGEDGQPSIVPEFEWLLGATGHLVAAILDDLQGLSDWPARVSQALKLLQHYSRQEPDTWHCMDKVRKVISRYPEVRRRLFWQHVEACKTEQGHVPTRWHELRYYHGLFELGSADIPWLQRDARSRTSIRECLLAFDTLARIPPTQERNEQHINMLRSIAGEDEALSKRLDRMLNKSQIVDPTNQKWTRQQHARNLRKEKEQQQSHDRLTQDIASIRDGSNFSALRHLLHVAQSQNGGNTCGATSTDPISEVYDDAIADAAETGWKAFWKNYEPQLPHERDSRHSTPYAAIVGLVGLNMDLNDGLSLSELPPKLLLTACRYATCEFSRFPGWLTRLAELHPATVEKALAPAIKADYSEDPVAHDVLWKLSQAPHSIKAACAHQLLRLIEASDPPTIGALEQCLSTLLATNNIDLTSISRLTENRCDDALEDNHRFSVWWLTWLTAQSIEALDYLERLLDGRPREEGYLLVEGICHRIYGVTEETTSSLRLDVDSLCRLIPIVYDYVSVSVNDDISHDGADTPAWRDNAQRVRGLLVQWLAEIPGQTTVDALLKLADDPLLTNVRDWILYQADKCRLANAERQTPRVVDQLVALYREHGTEAVHHVNHIGRTSSLVRVLFLAGRPRNQDPVAVDEEQKAIQEKLGTIELHNRVLLLTHMAVQSGDFTKALLEERPTVVHFSGHGAGAEGLVFHSESPEEHLLVSPDAVRSAFQILHGAIRIVVLNACSSAAQARVISNTIDFVVGMSGEIGDAAAIKFSTGFYQGLGAGESVQGAFDLGVLQMKVAGFQKDARLPELHYREGVDPAATVLLPRNENQ